MKKEFSKIKIIQKYNGGYSLIEVIISVLIITLSSGFLLYGITDSMERNMDIRLEQEALQELIMYTNEWQSFVAAGYSPTSGEQPPMGKRILIGNNDEIEALLFRNISLESSGQYSKYYNIKTRIEWNHEFMLGKKDRNLEFEVNQIVF